MVVNEMFDAETETRLSKQWTLVEMVEP